MIHSHPRHKDWNGEIENPVGFGDYVVRGGEEGARGGERARMELEWGRVYSICLYAVKPCN